jgi:histidinol-phosphate aminotransferase
MRLIGDQVGVDADQVVVGAGATGVAMQIMQALTTRGEKLVLGSPNFDGYAIMAAQVGLNAVAIPLDAAGRQDLTAMADAVDASTALIVVCRPHNPTGTVIPEGELEAFLSILPRGLPVVLDEAYVEFLLPADELDAVLLIKRHPNVIVLRTFSKAYGLAGLRIGYGFGDAKLIRKVHRLQLLVGIGETAVTAVEASFAAKEELDERISKIRTERRRLRAALLDRGIDVPDSHANFLFIPGRSIAETLARAGIGAKGYAHGSRIAVGDPDSGHAVLDALLGV